MPDMPDLDLNSPGTLWCTADFEDTTTFYIVLPDPKYNKAELSKNPTIAAGDQLMRPFVVNHTDIGADNKAKCDLKASGRSTDIINALGELSKAGKPFPEHVRGVAIVTALPGNKVPAKQLAECQDFKLIVPATIDLKAIKDIVTVQNWKAGQRDFIVEMTIGGPQQKVTLQTDPRCKIKVDGGPDGNGMVVLDVAHGQKYTIRVEAPLVFRQDTKQTRVPPSFRNWVPNGWRTGGARAKYDPAIGAWVVLDEDIGKVGGNVPWGTRTDTRELWTGGDVTLTASGMVRFNDLKKSIKLRAESWASDWLKGPPPPPFSHNVC